MKRYTYLVSPDTIGPDRTPCWTASVAESPGICGIGDTALDAVQELERIITFAKWGPMPEPFNDDDRAMLMHSLWTIVTPKP